MLRNRVSATRRSVGDKAFTLMEALVALSVVALALIPLLHLHIISVNAATRATRQSLALSLADAKMTEVLATGYPETGSASGSFEGVNPTVLQWRTAVSDVRLEQLAQAGAVELRRVCVEVTWRDGVAQERLQLVTYVSAVR